MQRAQCLPQAMACLDREGLRRMTEMKRAQRQCLRYEVQNVHRAIRVVQHQSRQHGRYRCRGRLLLAERIKRRLAEQRLPSRRSQFVGLLEQVADASGPFDLEIEVASRLAAQGQIAVDDPLTVNQAMVEQICHRIIDVQHLVCPDGRGPWHRSAQPGNERARFKPPEPATSLHVTAAGSPSTHIPVTLKVVVPAAVAPCAW